MLCPFYGCDDVLQRLLGRRFIDSCLTCRPEGAPIALSTNPCLKSQDAALSRRQPAAYLPSQFQRSRLVLFRREHRVAIRLTLPATYSSRDDRLSETATSVNGRPPWLLYRRKNVTTSPCLADWRSAHLMSNNGLSGGRGHGSSQQSVKSRVCSVPLTTSVVPSTRAQRGRADFLHEFAHAYRLTQRQGKLDLFDEASGDSVSLIISAFFRIR